MHSSEPPTTEPYGGWCERKALRKIDFPRAYLLDWEQVVGMGIPMICKLWPGTTHVDLGGNVIFLKTDQQEELENAILQVFNSPSIYINMKNIADGNRRKDFSYDYLSRISIEG